ncbi:S8 family serine peptidase [Succinimonas amylolytica]|uniref:S8 family serine peptidase n=1 Tax=Succinimonas amylolytica TaxID=83769 RepID=UPI0003672FC9|nr:S8 family serine peptidase [Succinimonas amylolytica]
MNMKRFSLTRNTAAVTAVILAGALLTGCGGSRSGSSSGANVVLEFRDGDYITGKPYRVTADRSLRDISCEYGVISKVHPVTAEAAGENEWFYVLPEEYFSSYDLDYDREKAYTESCRVTLTDGTAAEAETELAITDPLTADQWHLCNIGQNPYGVTQAPVRGIDLNVIPAWRTILEGRKEQLDGSGVLVAVHDIPADINHEDLRERIFDPGIPGSGDLINTGLSLEDLKEFPAAIHGSGVAGIIAASGMNGRGGRGIAFRASMVSIKLDLAAEARSLGYMLRMPGLSIVNASWGRDLETFSQPEQEDLYEALYERNIAVIHAQGNEFLAGYDENRKPYSSSICTELQLDCEFKQTTQISRDPFVINVGALNSLGVKSSYGSTGANLWVTGFGGEKGGKKDSDAETSAAIVTTSGQYDPRDWNDPDAQTPWRSPDNWYYTNVMNGTSSAAPTVSGAVALAYQAMPDMTVSQLRYLLATTSRNDSVMPSLALTVQETASDRSYGEPVVYDYGWQDNAAGFRFSSHYGFGVADAAALVKGALACGSDPVCAGLKELPEVYVSGNSHPCVFTDDTERNITCTFSDFRDPEDPESVLGSASLVVDAITYEVSGITYLSEGIRDFCKLAASPEDEDETEHNRQRKQAVFEANLLLQILAESPAGTKSLIKPLYANWDFKSGFRIPGSDYSNPGSPLSPLRLATSAFYREILKEDPEKHWTLSLKSPCRLDLDALNSSMQLMVYGRKEQ